MNTPSKAGLHKWFRQCKFVAFFGALAAIGHEKYMLDKKFAYYNKFYPEPTHLQRSLVQEAQMFKKREALGIPEKSMDDKKYLDPETQKKYEQFYMLPPQRNPEAEQDQNPAVVGSHWGKS